MQVRLQYCFHLFLDELLEVVCDPDVILRGKKQYEPPRFMTVNTAIEQLLEVEEARGESGMFMSFMLLLEKMVILQQNLSWISGN